MKSATARRHSNLRPKHKHTKEYLRHYYPFLPLLVSIGILLTVIVNPYVARPSHSVLAYSTNVSQATLLSSTNEQRAKAGASALTDDDKLQKAAQAKANDMVARNYWSHITPDGNQPWTFVSAQGYDYKKAGENLAFGFNSSSDVISGWMNSPTHRDNMLDKAFTQVGFATANSPNFTGTGPATVVVAMYAMPAPLKIASIGNSELLADTDQTNAGDSKTVNNAELLTKSVWATYAVAVSLGAAVMYLFITHSIGIKKGLRKGEKFVIHHPLIDSVVICAVAVGVILLQQAGYIF